MEIKPYDKNYLEDVSDNLGSMLEYAVGCQFNPQTIWEMFTCSVVAREIEKGNPKFLSGYSAREYMDIIINSEMLIDKKNSLLLSSNDSFAGVDNYYWAGYSLAYLQYETGMKFYEIEKYLPLNIVLSLYPTLHEADVRKFLDIAIEIIKNKKVDTNLKIIRKASGLSQSELAKNSKVDIRSIQMYEQRRNDINKAEVLTLYKIARTLGCNIEDLLEHI